MVKVMEFWGRQEGEVVSAVGDGGADQSHAVPHAGGGDVGAQDDRPDHHGQQVGELQHRRRTNICVCNGECVLTWTPAVSASVHPPRAPEDGRRWPPIQWERSTRGAACGTVCRGVGGGRA